MNANQEPEIPGSGIEARSKAAFDASVEELNAGVRSRLTQARFAAVAEAENGKRPLWQRMLVPITGLATAAILIAVLIVPGMTRHGRTGAALADDDIPLLLDSDNVEMIEDMEFYAWLDEDGADEARDAKPASEVKQ